ncbi:MAG: hypothetical protein M3O30_12710 [Planctomycetota bacterium]|nr:hypothetical protein [Planctomycetota bacterium]
MRDFGVHPFCRRHWVIFALMLTPALGMIVYDSLTDNLHGYPYQFRLTKTHIIQSSQGFGRGIAGPFQIVHYADTASIRRNPEPLFPDGSSTSAEYLEGVQEFAVFKDQFIIGKRLAGYFILDTYASKLDIFNSVQEYRAALKAAMIPDLSLQKPDDVARNLPGSTIRPWAYQVMQGLFGLSDIGLGAIVTDFWFILAITGGVLIPVMRRWRAWWTMRLTALCFGVALIIVVGFVINPLFDAIGDMDNGNILRAMAVLFGLPAAPLFSRDAVYWIDMVFVWWAGVVGIPVTVIEPALPPGGFSPLMRKLPRPIGRGPKKSENIEEK